MELFLFSAPHFTSDIVKRLEGKKQEKKNLVNSLSRLVGAQEGIECVMRCKSLMMLMFLDVIETHFLMAFNLLLFFNFYSSSSTPKWLI